jgi:polysaccharide export outer membrane protein
MLLLCLAGCTGNLGKSVARNPSSFNAPDPLPPPKVDADRRLMVGDVITVRIYKVDTLSGDQTIDSAGRINMALVGYIPAAGRTTSELEAQLKETLGAHYLTAPIVQVTVKAPVQNSVTVDGSVQQPGLYPVEANTTLIRTIAMARGTADGANPRRVVIFRQIDGQRMAASFDVTNIRRGKTPDPPVYANDVVIVDGSALNKTFKTMLQTLPFITLFRPF